MIDENGDMLKFETPIWVASTTDDWLIKVEDAMQEKVRTQINACYGKLIGRFVQQLEIENDKAIEQKDPVKFLEI